MKLRFQVKNTTPPHKVMLACEDEFSTEPIVFIMEPDAAHSLGLMLRRRPQTVPKEASATITHSEGSSDG